MKTRAYLIQSKDGEAVTLDHHRATAYAAQHHGIVGELVLRADVEAQAPQAHALDRGTIIGLISPLSRNTADHDIDFAFRVLDAAQAQQAGEVLSDEQNAFLMTSTREAQRHASRYADELESLRSDVESLQDQIKYHMREQEAAAREMELLRVGRVPEKQSVLEIVGSHQKAAVEFGQDPTEDNHRLLIEARLALLSALTTPPAPAQPVQGVPDGWRQTLKAACELLQESSNELKASHTHPVSGLISEAEVSDLVDQHEFVIYQIGEMLAAAAPTPPAQPAQQPAGDVVMDAWLPMDSAPRDGTEIAAIGNDWGNPKGPKHKCIAYFAHGKWWCMEWNGESSELQYLTGWSPIPIDAAMASDSARKAGGEV